MHTDRKTSWKIFIQGEDNEKENSKVEVTYDTEETWETTLQEVKELFKMMNNIKRNAIIIDIKGDKDDDGQDE